MKIGLLILGQSNEAGNCQQFTGAGACAVTGFSGDSISLPQRNIVSRDTQTDSRKHWWADTAAFFNKHSPHKIVTIRNCARAGTNIVANWCGVSGGVVYTMDDAGFDPNDYFDGEADGMGVAQQVARFSGVDEIWACLSWGQGDVARASTLAQYQAAHLNAAEYLHSIGVDRVYLGLSVHTENDSGDLYDDFSTAIANAVASGPSYVYAGADLYQRMGRWEALALHDSPKVHTHDVAQASAARHWARALLAS